MKFNPITCTTKIINLDLNENLYLWLYYLLTNLLLTSSTCHKGLYHHKDLQYIDTASDFNILGTTITKKIIADLVEADKTKITIKFGTT